MFEFVTVLMNNSVTCQVLEVYIMYLSHFLTGSNMSFNSVKMLQMKQFLYTSAFLQDVQELNSQEVLSNLIVQTHKTENILLRFNHLNRMLNYQVIFY